jgi:hypothetical protein
MNFQLSSHAREEMERRAISPALLESVLTNPEQVVAGHGGKRVYQSRLDFGSGNVYLLRAVVDDSKDAAVVVTVYRTSKITKYWRAT